MFLTIGIQLNDHEETLLDLHNIALQMRVTGVTSGFLISSVKSGFRTYLTKGSIIKNHR